MQKWSQPIIHTELNIRAVLYEDDLSNTRKKSGSSSERLFRIRGVFLTVASAGGCCQTPVHPKMHLCGASNVWRFFFVVVERMCCEMFYGTVVISEAFCGRHNESRWIINRSWCVVHLSRQRIFNHVHALCREALYIYVRPLLPLLFSVCDIVLIFSALCLEGARAWEFIILTHRV